jgi:hypothetical protein
MESKIGKILKVGWSILNTLLKREGFAGGGNYGIAPTLPQRFLLPLGCFLLAFPPART